MHEQEGLGEQMREQCDGLRCDVVMLVPHSWCWCALCIDFVLARKLCSTSRHTAKTLKLKFEEKTTIQHPFGGVVQKNGTQGVCTSIC